MVEKCIPKEKKREKTNKKHLVEEEIDESAVCSCTYAKKWQKIKEEEDPVWNKQIQYTTIVRSHRDLHPLELLGQTLQEAFHFRILA